jgi:hypothetical protein
MDLGLENPLGMTKFEQSSLEVGDFVHTSKNSYTVVAFDDGTPVLVRSFRMGDRKKYNLGIKGKKKDWRD